MRVTTKLLLSAAVAVSAFAGTAGAAELRQIGTISIPGEPLNSFDISWIDEASGLYFLADRSNKGVDIVDTKKGAWIGRLGGAVGPVMKKDGTCCNNDASGPNGVLTVDGKEVWVGDGDSTVKVYDLKTKKLIATIPTGGKARADELGYDPKDHVVAIANNADEPPFLTFISTKDHKIIGKLEKKSFTDGMEQTAYNPADGRFYTDIPEQDEDKTKGGLLVTDPKTLKEVKIITVPNCVPHGIAFGPGANVFLGCNAGVPRLKLPAKQVVVDSKTGQVMAEINGIGGSDESAVNNKLGHYYGALNGNPDGPILAVIDTKTNALLQKIPTGPGAHSVAASESLGRVYVPIAVEAGGLKGGCGCIAVYGTE
jgi:DNA-binding beta-propeller fold protein YncE